MIAAWPPKPRYNTKKLREAIDTTAHADALADYMLGVCRSRREALEELREMRDVVSKAIAGIEVLLSDQGDNVSNTHLTNIRDDLDAIIHTDKDAS